MLYVKKIYTNQLEKDQQPNRGSAKEWNILFIEKSLKHMKKYLPSFNINMSYNYSEMAFFRLSKFGSLIACFIGTLWGASLILLWECTVGQPFCGTR